jgi:two-component system NtrC family response regulator
MKSILYISQNSQSPNGLGDLASHQGYKLIPVHTDAEVRFCLSRAQHYHALVIDLTGEDETWFDLLEWISSQVPDTPILALIPAADLAAATRAIKCGAYDYLTDPVDEDEFFFAVSRVASLRLGDQIHRARNNQWDRERSLYAYSFPSSVMRNRMQRLAYLARHHLPIFLWGPPGIGVEQLARTIHLLSPYRFQSFLTVHDGQSPRTLDTLLPTDLHTLTSTAGDTTPKGGTLLIDEVGNLPAVSQYRLMDYLKIRELAIRKRSSLPVGYRLLFAAPRQHTQKNNVPEWIGRLHASILEIPPLTEHRDDILYLAPTLVQRFSKQYRKPDTSLSDEALSRLYHYHWPGDMVELQSVIQRAVLVADGPEIQASHLTFSHAPGDELQLRLRSFHLEDVEELLIDRVLKGTGGNISRTANTLGISRGTLYNKMRKYGLDKISKS